ncbi:MAG: hypothetical protein FGM32_07230 [Candidatus Kapabacteria bacterium]|nr:hypothetical protein [Candidatus Kapabacteria bacterium]
MAHIDLPDGAYGIRGPMMVRPDTAAALNELASVLLHDAHSLTAGEREFIATAVSRANNCTYCSNIHAAITAAHTSIPRTSILADADRSEAAWASPKVNALARLACAVRDGGKSVSQNLIDDAASLGATELEIHDSILIGAAFCMFNRYVDGLDTPTPPDAELYDDMGATRAQQGYRAILWKTVIAVFMCIAPSVLFAGTGSISGRVLTSDTKEPAFGVRVSAVGTKSHAFTKRDGSFSLGRIEAGTYSLKVTGVEVRDSVFDGVVVEDGKDTRIDLVPDRETITGREVVVYGVSRRPQKITETPAAVTVVTGEKLQRLSRANQLGRALEGLNGVDVVQNGATDFNVNTRGFNNSTNRRLLVLVDGRDVALQQIGAVEWNSFASPLQDLESIELVRGPAAALYGANAFNGVLNIRTLSPREAQGTKISLLGGDYKTMRADVRHAGTIGDFAYKITMGRSQSYNLAQNRMDSASMVAEYTSLWPAARELNPLSSENRETFATYGTLRMDYDINEEQTVLAEFGYSQFGNEVMLAGAGRIHVPRSEKPFARLAYNDHNLHIQGAFNQRSTLDTMRVLAAPPGTIILDDSYDLNLDAQYVDTISPGLSYVVGGQYQYLSVASSRTVFPNEPILARIGGIYGQIEAKIADPLTLVASVRYDNANIYPQQLSPRVALLYKANEDHSFRVTAGRSFQRANFSELFRLYAFRPAFDASGRPINFRGLQQRINDTLSALSGSAQRVFMGLYDTTVTNQRDPRGIQPGAYGVGNPGLNVEQNVGIEFGYSGRLGSSFTFSVDAYYNRLTNFISGFLPGVNSSYAIWSSAQALPAELRQYSGIVDSMVYAQLSPQDRARFSTYMNNPAFVVSNTNLGLVEQYGVELSATYAVSRQLEFSANYAFYAANLLDAKTPNPFLKSGRDLLSPNTSPHRFNISGSYSVPMEWDVAMTLRYVEGFEWLAGDFRGDVPSYAVVNLNAGYYVTNDLRIGLAINNLLDRRHYEIYGGSNIPRLTYLSATYSFD